MKLHDFTSLFGKTTLCQVSFFRVELTSASQSGVSIGLIRTQTVLLPQSVDVIHLLTSSLTGHAEYSGQLWALGPCILRIICICRNLGRASWKLGAWTSPPAAGNAALPKQHPKSRVPIQATPCLAEAFSAGRTESCRRLSQVWCIRLSG